MQPLVTLRSRRSGLTRFGLTLLELLVVLTILVGLAGIVIPLLPSMLTRTQDATAASNVSAINRMVQVYQQLYMGYPDQWDLLGDGSTMIDYFPLGSGSPTGVGSLAAQVGGQLTSGGITGEEAAALQAAGIYNVHPMVATFAAGKGTAGWDPTFNPYVNPVVSGDGGSSTLSTGTPISAGMVFAQIPGTLAATSFGATPTGKYIMLGLGQRNTMVGKVMSEAPVGFADTQNLNPAVAYARFVAIFKVSDNGVALPAAVFVGALQLDDDGIMTSNGLIQEYYQQK